MLHQFTFQLVLSHELKTQRCLNSSGQTAAHLNKPHRIHTDLLIPLQVVPQCPESINTSETTCYSRCISLFLSLLMSKYVGGGALTQNLLCFMKAVWLSGARPLLPVGNIMKFLLMLSWHHCNHTCCNAHHEIMLSMFTSPLTHRRGSALLSTYKRNVKCQFVVLGVACLIYLLANSDRVGPLHRTVRLPVCYQPACQKDQNLTSSAPAGDAAEKCWVDGWTVCQELISLFNSPKTTNCCFYSCVNVRVVLIIEL